MEKIEKQSQKLVVSSIIVVGVIIAGAILLKGSQPLQKEVKQDTTAPIVENTQTQNGEHILGNPNAEVMIVEYSDTECPFCKRFHQTMHSIVETDPRVAWTYKHYPIPQLHELAFNESLASECAWEQSGNNGFWNYIDEIYERTNSNDSLPPTELLVIAEDLNLDTREFSTCLEEERYKDKVQADIAEGQSNGVTGTPMSLIMIDGAVMNVIRGAQPEEVVRAMIEEALINYNQ